jgi:GNAT superfamily N-acetyltransferase
MGHHDIPAGLRLCRLANWNQVAADWRFFLTSSPDGCRVAVDDSGRVIGTVATITYGRVFTWIGMVLVDPERRGAGIGTRLLHEALGAIGNATTPRLDATPAGRRVYVPLGFEEEYELQRMVRPPTFGLRTDAFSVQRDRVRHMSAKDFADIAPFDGEVFGADRRALLERCRVEAPEYTWIVGDTRVNGYLFGRHGHAFEHLGPLVAHDEETARLLVGTCLSAHSGKSFVIDTPSRASWTGWLASAGFTEQRPFTRMRRGVRRYRDRVDQLFAIAGPEFG